MTTLSETDQDSPVEILKFFPEFKYDMKTKQITLLQYLYKLSQEVETELFLSKIRRIILGFNLLKQADNVLYSSEEIESISQSLLKAFTFNFKGKIILKDSAYNEFDPQNLIKVKIDDDYISTSSHGFNKKWFQFITSYLPITNFEDTVFEKAIEIYKSLGNDLSLNLLNQYYNKIVENTFQRVEELLTTLLVFMMILKYSKSCPRNITQIFNFFVANPFENVESDSRLRSKEQKLIIDLLCSQISVSAYKVIS